MTTISDVDLQIRKEEGRRIDPETALVTWKFAYADDPYFDGWARWKCLEPVYFARAPGSHIWVCFDDLPKKTRKRLWQILDCLCPRKIPPDWNAWNPDLIIDVHARAIRLNEETIPTAPESERLPTIPGCEDDTMNAVDPARRDDH